MFVIIFIAIAVSLSSACAAVGGGGLSLATKTSWLRLRKHYGHGWKKHDWLFLGNRMQMWSEPDSRLHLHGSMRERWVCRCVCWFCSLCSQRGVGLCIFQTLPEGIGSWMPTCSAGDVCGLHTRLLCVRQVFDFVDTSCQQQFNTQ